MKLPAVIIVIVLLAVGIIASAKIIKDDRGPNWLVRDVVVDELSSEVRSPFARITERLTALAEGADDQSVLLCVIRIFGSISAAQLYRAMPPHLFFVPPMDTEPFVYEAKLRLMKERVTDNMPIAEYIRVGAEKEIVIRAGLGGGERRPLKFGGETNLRDALLIEATTTPAPIDPTKQSPGLILFVRSESSGIAGARVLYDSFRNFVGLKGYLRVYTRPDPWFEGLPFFPAFSLAVNNLAEAPSWNLWITTPTSACRGSGRYPEACWTEPLTLNGQIRE